MDEQPRLLLLVDDELDYLQAMTEQLTQHGYHVIMAESALLALELLNTLHFDNGVLITDFNMPGGDGIYLIEEIKKGDTGIETFILTSGSHDYGQEKLEYLERESVHRLQKPYTVDSLSKILDGKKKVTPT